MAPVNLSKARAPPDRLGRELLDVLGVLPTRQLRRVGDVREHVLGARAMSMRWPTTITPATLLALDAARKPGSTARAAFHM
jgi:hypothetical protein